MLRMETYKPIAILTLDNALKLVGSEQSYLQQFAQLIARDVPFAMDRANCEAVEDQDTQTKAPGHDRGIEQIKAATGVDDIEHVYSREGWAILCHNDFSIVSRCTRE